MAEESNECTGGAAKNSGSWRGILLFLLILGVLGGLVGWFAADGVMADFGFAIEPQVSKMAAITDVTDFCSLRGSLVPVGTIDGGFICSKSAPQWISRTFDEKQHTSSTGSTMLGPPNPPSPLPQVDGTTSRGSFLKWFFAEVLGAAKLGISHVPWWFWLSMIAGAFVWYKLRSSHKGRSRHASAHVEREGTAMTLTSRRNGPRNK